MSAGVFKLCNASADTVQCDARSIAASAVIQRVSALSICSASRTSDECGTASSNTNIAPALTKVEEASESEDSEADVRNAAASCCA